MEGGDNLLEAIYEDENMDDVEMLDVEEGECVDNGPSTGLGQMNGEDVKLQNPESQSQSKNCRRKARKKKNKKRKSGSGPDFVNIDRFVMDICRRLKEKKSYMVYTAVGCLGVSALSDLVKEVDAIQACGGQMTADGKRFRTGGGILWNIIKTREPNAYKEIMKKAKEFEKQFRQPNVKKVPEQKVEGSSSKGVNECTGASSTASLDGLQLSAQIEERHEDSSGEPKRLSVHERMRAPVSYDDELLAGDEAGGSN